MPVALVRQLDGHVDEVDAAAARDDAAVEHLDRSPEVADRRVVRAVGRLALLVLQRAVADVQSQPRAVGHRRRQVRQRVQVALHRVLRERGELGVVEVEADLLDHRRLAREVPLDGEILGRDDRAEVLELAAHGVVVGAPDDLVVAGLVDERADRALRERIGDEEPHALRDGALVAQPLEDLVGALGLRGVPDALEADLVHALADGEAPLVVVALGEPVVVRVARAGLEVGMAVVGVPRDEGDPLRAIAELAVGEHRHVVAERGRAAPEDVLDGPVVVEPGDAAHQQHVAVVGRRPRRHVRPPRSSSGRRRAGRPRG